MAMEIKDLILFLNLNVHWCAQYNLILVFPQVELVLATICRTELETHLPTDAIV